MSRTRGDLDALVRDAPRLAAVPLALVAVHLLLAPATRDALAFEAATVEPVTMWTAAYVHVDEGHLWSNVAGYWLAVLPAWVLHVKWGRRDRFWAAVAVVLVAVPFVTAAGSYLAFRFVHGATETAVTRGFSGVVGGLAGVLFGSLVVFLAERYDRFRASMAAQFLLLVLSVLVLYGLAADVPLPLAALLVAGLVAAGVGVLPRDRRPAALYRAALAERWSLALVAYGACSLALLSVSLFPADVTTGGGITNVYSHAAGLVAGAGVPLATHRVRGGKPRGER